MLRATIRQIRAQALRFGASAGGATAIEYGVLMSLLVLAIIAGASVTGTSLSDMFNDIMRQVSDALNKS